MGTVHDILEAQGKAAALTADLGRPVVEAASLYMSDEAGGIGYLYSGWCQAALPHRRPADDATWQITRPNLTLVVEPGRRLAPDKSLVYVGVPYGSRARLILLYLQSEALRTGSREVSLGRSLRDWLGRMNISVGGKTAIDVREQADRIARCRLTFHLGPNGKDGLLNQSIMDAAMFVPAEDPDRSTLFVEVARLSQTFFDELRKHPVPLEESAIRAISNNSMALDAYVWLAYRLHVLEKSTPVSWHAIKAQFGGGIARMTNFRATFLPNLKLALAVYREAKVEVTEQGLLLIPSPPPVAPRIIAVS